MTTSVRHIFSFLIYALFAIVGITPSSSIHAQGVLPPNFIEAGLVTGLNRPTSMAFALDGRLFVTLQDGVVRIIDNNALLPNPFLTVPVNAVGERGLLGLTFDPNFATNSFVYVYYTATAPVLHNRVSRFTANGNVVVPGSEVILFELEPLGGASNHNGGALHFGPDGKLYIATGENAVPANAQSLDSTLGKILRINTDGTIPPDNPFFNTTNGNNRAVWSYGLRNPFTFAFQPGSGRMYINDVGAGNWEEINEGFRGANYGWPNTEGPTTNAAFRSPIYAYNHNSPGFVCAITGGDFYNPQALQFPIDYIGDYFFADYCGNWIQRYDVATNSVVTFAAVSSRSVVDLDVSNDGSLYYLARGDAGTQAGIFRIVFAPGQAPTMFQNPANLTTGENQNASFTCIATGSSPLTYQWQRDGTNIVGATGTTYTFTPTTLADSSARFRCLASNPSGTSPSQEAVLTVVPGQPPVGTILLPTNGSLYSGGESIALSGSALDNEDGPLPPTAFSWAVDFHHDTHTHPFIGSGQLAGLQNANVIIPSIGETSVNVWYRIYLTVTDSSGLTHTVFHDIQPRVVNLRLQTNPTTLQVALDGQPQLAPLTFTSVAGVSRTLSAFAQAGLGSTWVFDSWDFGGPAVQSILTPTVDTTYIARYIFGLLPTPQSPAPQTLPGILTSTKGFAPNITIDAISEAGRFGVVGGTIVWTIRVTNTGDQNGTTLSLLNTFPAELNIGNIESTLPFRQNGNSLSLDLNTLTPGQVIELRVTSTLSRSPTGGSLVTRAVLMGLDSAGSRVTSTAEGNLVVVEQLPSTGHTNSYVRISTLLVYIATIALLLGYFTGAKRLSS